MNHLADELQHLRRECEEMLKDQDSWKPEELPKDFVLDLMRRFVKTTPRKGVSTDLIADLCDLFGPHGADGMKGTYKLIAEQTGKSLDAVRKSYERKRRLMKY